MVGQYGAEPFEQQQFGTSGTERVNNSIADTKVTKNNKDRQLQIRSRAYTGLSTCDITQLQQSWINTAFHEALCEHRH